MPSLLSGTAAVQKGNRFWIYPLIAALFLNAGMIFWWGHQNAPRDESSATPYSITRHQVAMQPAEAPAGANESRMSPLTQDSSDATRVTSLRPASLQKEEQEVRPADLRKKATAVTDVNHLTGATNKTAPEQRAVRGGRVLALRELPPAVKQTLPEFRVSGHAYGPEPSSRVVRINEQILQEGQSLAPGLRVEEITPNGVILDRQGFRFQIGINTD